MFISPISQGIPRVFGTSRKIHVVTRWWEPNELKILYFVSRSGEKFIYTLQNSLLLVCSSFDVLVASFLCACVLA